MANGEDNGMSGLLGNPMFNLGVGLLGAGLNRPQNVGQGLLSGLSAGTELQGAALKNQEARARLEQLSRQQRLGNELQNLLERHTSGGTRPVGPSAALDANAAAGAQPGPTTDAAQLAGQQVNMPGPISGPQAEMLGLLGQVDPKAGVTAAVGLLSPDDRRPNSLIEQAQFVFPQDPDKQRQFVAENSGGGGDLDRQLQMLDMRQRQLEFQRQQRELNQQERDQKQAQGELVASLRTDLNRGEELAELVNDLEGTALETGVPLSQMRRAATSGASALGNLVGVDTSDSQQLVGKFDRFNKLATNFAINSATRLFDSGRISNFQLQAIQDAQVSPTVSPEANRLVIADNLQHLLEGADRAGIEIKDQEQFESTIQGLRGEAEGSSNQERTFQSEAEAQQAIGRGEVRVGETVIVGGERFRVEE